MKLRVKYSFGSVLSIFQFVFSVVVCLLIANDANKPSYYHYLWILPIICGGGAFLISVSNPDYMEDIRYLIISSLFFVRNSVTPLFMYLGDYAGIVTRIDGNSAVKSIALMTIETIVVLAYAAYATKKYRKSGVSYSFVYSHNSNNLILLIALGLFCAVTIVANPSYMSDFISLFSGTNIRMMKIGTASASAWYTLFVMLFPITYMFFCMYIMRIINSLSRSFFKIAFNIMLIITPLFFMNNSDAFNLICSLSIALVSLYNNGISKKIFIVFVSVGVSAIVVVLFLMITELSIEASHNSAFRNLSISFQAYFPGVCNNAGVFNIGNSYSKFTTFFYDVYSIIPFRNTIFEITTNHSLTTVWGTENGINSQILPCIGQLFFYFSIFGPMAECLLVKIAYKTYKKMQSTESAFLYLTRCICFIYFIITPVMYNYTILLSRFFITIFPMYVFSGIVEMHSGKLSADRYATIRISEQRALMEKVLIVMHNLKVGNGVANCIMQYYDNLIENGFCIDFLLTADDESQWRSYVSQKGDVYLLPKTKIKYSKEVNNAVNTLFQNNNYSAVHVNIPGPYGALILKFAKRNEVGLRIYHSHNPQNSLSLRGKLTSLVFDFLCRNRANSLLACSEDAGKSSFGSKRFTTLKNCIDVNFFKFNLDARDKIRHSLGLGEDTFLVGSVGRIDQQKNPIFALECFKELLKIRKDAYYIWLGTGKMKGEVDKYVKVNNLEKSVLFVGIKDNVNEWYSAMDCFLLPSVFEGLGIAYIEAQASGLECFGSTGVPGETEITSLMRRLDLALGARFWAQEIAKTNTIKKRLTLNHQVKEAGYDIITEKGALTNFYVSELKNVKV